MTATALDTPVAAADPTPLGAKLYESTLCLSLSITQFGLSKRARMDMVTVNADKQLLRMSKKLLRSETYGKIKAEAGRMRTYLREVAIPAPFKSSVYLVPIPMVETVSTKLAESKARFEGLVDEFCTEYPNAVQAIEADLGDLFNALDYPPVERVRVAFTYSWQYVSFDVPGRLKHVSEALFKHELAKAQEYVSSAAEVVRQGLRDGMAKMVATMVERLSPAADGKKRVLRESTVDNLAMFLGAFDIKNVTDDAALQELVIKARALINNVDAEQIRSDDALRANLLASFEGLNEELKPMAVSRHFRAIDLSMDDEAAGA